MVLISGIVGRSLQLLLQLLFDRSSHVFHQDADSISELLNLLVSFPAQAYLLADILCLIFDSFEQEVGLERLLAFHEEVNVVALNDYLQVGCHSQPDQTILALELDDEGLNNSKQILSLRYS